jgi:hypothetical protein
MKPDSQSHTIRARVPRYIRRMIHGVSRCHYQREEYATALERNERFTLLRRNGLRGLVRYSELNAAGLWVWVVAWPRPSDADGDGHDSAHGHEGSGEPGPIDTGNSGGMTDANRKTPGGPPVLPLGENCENLES